MARIGSELLRKAVHVGMGGFALSLRWLRPWQAALLALVAVGFNLLLLHRLTRRALLRSGERQRGFSWGIALYPAVVLMLVLVFFRRLELAAGVWALLAFGDGMATVAGVTVGGPRLPWNRDKSWVGLLTFVLYGTASMALLIRWTQRAVIDAGLSTDHHPVHWIGSSFLARSNVDAVIADATFLLLGCLVVALIAGLVESLKTGLDDNVLVPLVGGAALYAATLVEPARLAAASGSILRDGLWGAGINIVLAVGAYAARSVSRSGAVVGWMLGTALFALSGWRGFAMLLVFFVLGTATTKMGYAKKVSLGIAQSRGGRRGAGNAIANTGAAVVCAFLAVATPHSEMFTLAMIAAFATATCDTVSSEIGQAYGRHHYLVTSFRPVRAGTDGAVSVEGTLGGIVAAAVLAVCALVLGLADGITIAIVVAAAFFGATFESYLGATVERLKWIDNELINFTNTVVGAAAAGGLFHLVGRT